MSYPLPKRLLDKTFALVMLLVLSPVILALLVVITVSMIVRPQDRGPLLYRERRVSRGRPFALLKFRTLRADVAAGEHARFHSSSTSSRAT